MKYAGIVIGLIMLLIIGVVGGYAFDWWAAPYKGKLEARQQINSGSYRIAAYNSFYDQCASIQGLEQLIGFTEHDLANATTDSEKRRLNTNLVAAQVARADAIAQYNADSHKSYTFAQFKSSDLPYQIDIAPFKGVLTTCTA